MARVRGKGIFADPKDIRRGTFTHDAYIGRLVDGLPRLGDRILGPSEGRFGWAGYTDPD